jgi:hypothetical protein
LSGENAVKDFKEIITIFKSWDRFYCEDMKDIMVIEFEEPHLEKFT